MLEFRQGRGSGHAHLVLLEKNTPDTPSRESLALWTPQVLGSWGGAGAILTSPGKFSCVPSHFPISPESHIPSFPAMRDAPPLPCSGSKRQSKDRKPPPCSETYQKGPRLCLMGTNSPRGSYHGAVCVPVRGIDKSQ